MKTTQIKVNGQAVAVVASYSCGPGEATHTYEFGRPGCTGLLQSVRKTAGGWFLEDGSSWCERLSCYGQFVTVEAI